MDLNSLNPEQLASLKRQLDGLTSTDGRSPFRARQLHDLNKKPGATDPRPLFVWSADSPVDYIPTAGSLYPRLMWSTEADARGNHREITVHSVEEQYLRIAEGFQVEVPALIPVDPIEQIQAQFDALSPEDQKLMLEAQAQDKRARLQAKLANLSEDQLERLLASSQPKGRKKSA